jgi:hypothetical protein
LQLARPKVKGLGIGTFEHFCNYAKTLDRERVIPYCSLPECPLNYLMKHTKNSKLAIWGMISAFALSVLTVGCERTISQTESTKVKSDGTVESKEKKVTENPDGTITKTERKTTDKP